MRKLTPDKIQQIRKLAAKGIPQEEIAKMLGVGVGTVNKYRVGPVGEDLPPGPAPDQIDVSDDALQGIDVSTVDKWLSKIDSAAEAARVNGDYQAMSSLMAKYVALLEHKRKATPPAPPDPNTDPDFIEAARLARERLHKLIDTAVGNE